MGKQVFILEVSGTKNGSWQGTLKWVDGRREESFRSMLELLHLIDSAIELSEGEGPPCQNPEWEELLKGG